MNLIVVDASVVVKWFVEEEYSKDADRIRKDYLNQLIDIAVPSLLKYEVLNALRYSHAFGEDELREVGKALDDYQFLTIPLREEYLDGTIRRALKHGITIYDASYIAIGDVRRCEVYTADNKLLNKVGDDPIIKHVRNYRSRL
ncbi:MAG: PIN domain nuclease [Thermoprotei archaeon]|nr:MAG: PIN domain nuclease [Thermofilum sp. ex4484_79]RLF03141.1 MAG: PIN domain nuclease [Thermoprotei archaeon]